MKFDKKKKKKKRSSGDPSLGFIVELRYVVCVSCCVVVGLRCVKKIMNSEP